MRSFVIAAGIFFSYFSCAQPTSDKIVTGTISVGLSAASSQSIVAKTYKAPYPFYDYGTDSLSQLFLFSSRQENDAGSQYPSKGFIGGIHMEKDSIEWLFDSNYYEVLLRGNSLFFSNDKKTTKYNKLHGFVDLSYPAKFLYTTPAGDRAFLYKNPDVLSCINTADGATSWTAAVPGHENWIDVLLTGDSMVLIAAAGLHGIYPRRGLIWSYSLTTSAMVTKALTYSLVNKSSAVRHVNTVIKTSDDETSVTELSSNILTDQGSVYFAGKEKIIAVSTGGKLLWELDLKEYPVSKMFLSKRGASLLLVNFGLARFADNYVIYGNPFALSIDAKNGKVNYRIDISAVENLMDYWVTNKSMIFAGKKNILELKDGSSNAEILLTLDVNRDGSFAEFLDGSSYYTEKKGVYVSLDGTNNDLVFFKADNNKVYGIGKGKLDYSYHFTEIYKLEKKITDMIVLTNHEKTLVLSNNFELRTTLDFVEKPVVLGSRVFFIGENTIHSMRLDEIR